MPLAVSAGNSVADDEDDDDCPCDPVEAACRAAADDAADDEDDGEAVVLQAVAACQEGECRLNFPVRPDDAEDDDEDGGRSLPASDPAGIDDAVRHSEEAEMARQSSRFVDVAVAVVWGFSELWPRGLKSATLSTDLL